MAKFKKLKPVMETDRDSMPSTVCVCVTEADEDWLRAARLKKRAVQGDEQAKKELERKEKTILGQVVE